jgi:hypothetical protein
MAYYLIQYMSFIPTSVAVVSALTQAAHGFAIGDPVYLNGSIYTIAKNTIQANSNSIGVVSSVPTANTFTIAKDGEYITGLPSGTPGAVSYLSATGVTGTALTTTIPTSGYVRQILIRDTATSGYVQQYTAGASVGASGIAYASANITPSAAQVANNSAVDFTGMTVTLPSAGKYWIYATVR